MEANQWKLFASGIVESYQVNLYEGRHVDAFKGTIWHVNQGPDASTSTYYDKDLLDLTDTISRKVNKLLTNPETPITWI